MQAATDSTTLRVSSRIDLHENCAEFVVSYGKLPIVSISVMVPLEKSRRKAFAAFRDSPKPKASLDVGNFEVFREGKEFSVSMHAEGDSFTQHIPPQFNDEFVKFLSAVVAAREADDSDGGDLLEAAIELSMSDK